MYPYAATRKTLQLGWSDWLTYNWDTVQRLAPASAGVYVLGVKLTTGKLEVFYVGQTDNLDRRLKEHLADSEPNKCIKGNLKYSCVFRFASVAYQSDRDKAERALYKRFNPSCNDGGAIPDVEDVTINF